MGNRDGVHVTHCCVRHGCKYDDVACPVRAERVQQLYPCETCQFVQEEQEYWVDRLVSQGWTVVAPGEHGRV